MNIRTFGSFLAVSLAATAATRPDMLASTEWLAQHLNDPKLVILHVSGNRNAYDAGHIPGARFIAQGDLVVTRNGVPNEVPAMADITKIFEAAGISDDSRVILYSDSSVLPATRAYFTLDYMGHGDQAALLDGGLEKWRTEGRMLTKDAPPAAAQGHITPHAKTELVVQVDAVKQMTAKPSPSDILLDVRPATDFSGEKGSHIPTALNAPWLDNQMSRENQTLKSEAELRKQFEAAGITPNKKVVTYCNSGMQATESYFTLKYLGYDVRMYDGSMSEWTMLGAPVTK